MMLESIFFNFNFCEDHIDHDLCHLRLFSIHLGLSFLFEFSICSHSVCVNSLDYLRLQRSDP